MPDDLPPTDRFPHLRLISRETRKAKYGGGGKTPTRVKNNKRDRVGHSGRLRQWFDDIATKYRGRVEARLAAGLPPIEVGIPFVVEIPDKYKLDDLIRCLKLEVVAEDEISSEEASHRYVLVAVDSIVDPDILKRIEEFAVGKRGSAAVASVLEIISDPEDDRRLSAILSPKLHDKWPLPVVEEMTLDVSFQTRGVLADLGVKPRKSKNESRDDHQKNMAIWFDENKTRLFRSWDEFSLHLEAGVQRIIEAHGGEVVRQWENGQWGVAGAKVSFPDSITIRIKMCGAGFTDLILNHPRVFEVQELDEAELIDTQANAAELQPPAFELRPPSIDAPLVCVIDSGMQENHRLLAVAIETPRSICFVPGKSAIDTADEVRDGGHGTRVGGAVLYPEEIPLDGNCEARCRLGNARVLGEDRALPYALLPPAMLAKVVEHFPGCKIFVHSINARTPSPTRHMSAWSTKMDELSHAKDVLFIVSAGNLPDRVAVPGKGFLDHLEDDESHPKYLLSNSARIASPAQSLQALTVGSIAICDYDDGSWKSISGLEKPSAFSRSGHGIWGTIKPDVVEFGGDVCVPKRGPPLSGVFKGPTSPALVRSTLNGGPEYGRDAVGTSFTAPKVAALAAELQRLFPNRSSLLYRALIANSARWPQWAEELPCGERINAFRWIGYGKPFWNRALFNDNSRITLITADDASLCAGEAAVFEVPIPASLRTPGEERRLRIDVTLSYSSEPRRTRSSLNGYQAVWLDWISSRLRESQGVFFHRMWKDAPPPDVRGGPAPVQWMLSENEGWGRSRGVRRQGTLQKDWAIVSGFDIPESFAVAVRGHRGWNAADETATARFALAVSIEALDPHVRVYEPIRIELERINAGRIQV